MTKFGPDSRHVICDIEMPLILSFWFLLSLIVLNMASIVGLYDDHGPLLLIRIYWNPTMDK